MKESFDPQISALLRKAGIAARDALSEAERNEKSEKIAEAILASEEFQSAKIIMIYKGIRGEVRLEALEQAKAAEGKLFVYPLCISKTEMIALHPHGKDAWMRGSYGITEPVREKSDEILPDRIDLVICPCTVFDEQCNRIGMGGGFYDRYLMMCKNAHIAAAAFETQKTDRIPAASWDHPMEKVFTETHIYAKRR